MTARWLALAFAALALTSPASARTWYINPDGTGDATTIQAGLDLAAAGDDIEVACGSYSESLVMKSAVTLRGSMPGCVILQGDHMRQLMRIEDADDRTRIENLVFVNGLDEIGALGRGQGGAVYCESSAPVFVECQFSGNRAGYYRSSTDQAPGDGGAVYCGNSSPVFEDCDFQVNRARSTTTGANGRGGGLFLSSSSATLIRCSVVDNRAQGRGGGLCGEASSLSIRDCYFLSNESISDEELGSGGAIYESAGFLELVDCTLTMNLADYGGGVHASSAEVTGCTFVDNVAHDGGGMIGTGVIRSSVFFRNELYDLELGQGGGLVAGSGTSVEDCVFQENVGGNGGAAMGGIWIGCLLFENLAVANVSTGGALLDPESVTACTIVANLASRGAGLSGSPEIRNSLIAFNQGGEGIRGEAVLTCSDVVGNEGGDWVGAIADQFGINGNLSADPLFCDTEGDDFHLQWGSPCLPANSSGCGLIGRYGFGGCNSISVTPETWGQVKARFRTETDGED